ncbi:MAG: hypothetical protein M3445_04330 [Actinomycetota bacterium]|nr:hypothetical protein [Actinomycetota bacterium]
MILIATYPPVPATLSDPNVTASRFLTQPSFVARRLQTLGDLRYIGTSLLNGRMETNGGAVGYENVEAIFADASPEIVAPGAEYKLTTIGDGPAGIARVTKWGQDTLITDEAIVRRNMDPVEKGMLKLVNSAAVAIDAAVISVVASSITATRPAAAPWTGSGGSTNPPKTLQDVLLAVAAVRGMNLGYDPNVLLVDDSTWAYLASDSVIAGAMAREAATNPIYTGRFGMLAGLQVIHAPAANLPGGVGTNAWVLDSRQLGFIATENLGGGYQAAGDLIESKVLRLDENDAWRIRARANFVPVVTDAGAGFKITGVA